MHKKFQAVLFDFDGTLAHLTLDFKHMRKQALAELAAVLGPDDPALGRDDLPGMELIYAACKKQPPAVQAEIAERAVAPMKWKPQPKAACSLIAPPCLNHSKRAASKTPLSPATAARPWKRFFLGMPSFVRP